jgi:hypothetical protein
VLATVGAIQSSLVAIAVLIGDGRSASLAAR